MHKLILPVALLALSLTGYSQSCDQPAPPADVKKMSSLLGVWTGEFEDAGKKNAISIRFYEEGQILKAQITNAAHSSSGYIADVSLCSTDKFHFFGTRLGVDFFRYNVRLVNGELVGNYKIGRVCSQNDQGTYKLQKART